jgi:hypothetical protein
MFLAKRVASFRHAPQLRKEFTLDQPGKPEAGIDAMEHLAYLIAKEMVRELNLQAGSEMLKVLKAAQPAKPKVRTAGIGG